MADEPREPREPQGREAEVLAARRASLERLGRERAFAIDPDTCGIVAEAPLP